MPSPPLPHSRLYRGVFLVAFATLLFQVSLIRVFSFTIWHHFGYVVISTALLGSGASGTFLAVRPKVGRLDLEATLVRLGLWAAVSAAGVLVFISFAPLHPMSILEEPRQAVLFIAYQIATAVPFFFAGLVVSLALRHAAQRVDRLYFWDLVGAGLGCGVAVPLMNVLTPPGVVVASAALFAAGAAVLASRTLGRLVGVGLAVLLGIGTLWATSLPLTPARTKQLALQLGLLGFEPYFDSWTALFRTDVAEDVAKLTQGVHDPGSSRRKPAGELPVFYVHHDATAGTGIYDLTDSYELDHLEHSVLRLPYLLVKPQPRVLVIGVGGGHDMIAARQFGATRVVGIELDPVTVDVVRTTMGHVTHGFFDLPEIDLRVGEGRHFVRTTDEKFDLIQLTGVDTLSADSSGSRVLVENFLYTTEAVRDFMRVLEPGGILSLAMGNLNPDQPRAAGRMVSVAQAALREMGIENPEDHIVAVDSKNLYTEVMIANRPFRPEALTPLLTLSEELGFVPLLLPGRPAHPVFEGLAGLQGDERRELLRGLPYLVNETTDDRPFFFHFYRWQDLFEPGTVTPSHTTALAQIIFGLLLISLTALGTLFILAPLFVFRRRGIGGRGNLTILLYFLGVGLGFMFFEISLIQRFVLFLGYPTYSLSVTLFSLLVFLGWGSFLSRRWVGREAVVLPLAVVALALLTVFYIYGLPWVQEVFGGLPILLRSAIAAVLLLPLGLVLGSFFPLGIRIAAQRHPDLVPWAWAINGCASVTAGVLAVVLAISFGFSRVWLASVVIYGVAVVALLAGRRGATSSEAVESPASDAQSEGDAGVRVAQARSSVTS